MLLRKLSGAENGVFENLRADWEANNISFYEDVVYGQGGGHDLYLDLMIPNEKTDEPRAVIVWIHGGGWTSKELTKKYRPTKELIKACKMGFAVVSIEYRLVSEAPFPAPIEDCKCAIRFIKAHADELGIDSERIGVWGESAGGQLAALVGASYSNPKLEGSGGWNEYSSEVKAVCDWYFGGDMTFLCNKPNEIIKGRASSLGIKLCKDERDNFEAAPEEESDEFVRMFLGSNADEAAELIMDISPIFYVDRKQPPYLLMHGDADKLVPIRYTYNFYDALIAHGHDASLVVVPNQGHGFFTGDEYYNVIFDFFKKHLMS